MPWPLSTKSEASASEPYPFEPFKLEAFLTARDREALISNLEWQLAQAQADLKAQAHLQAELIAQQSTLLDQLQAVVDANALLRAKLWHKKRPRPQARPTFNNPPWDEPQNP